MWTYTQMRGTLTHDGVFEGTGYSGHNAGLNNPAMEANRGVGPIPRGLWKMGPWYDHPHLGPCVSLLSSIGHNAHGRTEIFIHGDNSQGNQSASHGCVILGRVLRHLVRDSADTSLTVTR